jgi:hypothetical protein
MEIKYHLFENENLFVQKFTGIFSIEDYIRYNRYITKYVVSKPIKKILIDFRELDFSDLPDAIPDDFNFNLEKVIEIRKKINDNELKGREVTIVIWVDKPIPTLIAHLFTDNFTDKNYNYCSSADNIITILKIPQNLTDLEYITHNLENTF